MAAHVRNDAEGVIPAIMELIEAATEIGVKLQIWRHRGLWPDGRGMPIDRLLQLQWSGYRD